MPRVRSIAGCSRSSTVDSGLQAGHYFVPLAIAFEDSDEAR